LVISDIVPTDPEKVEAMKTWLEFIGEPTRKRLEHAGIELKEIL
jgi:hypothetical protein